MLRHSTFLLILAATCGASLADPTSGILELSLPESEPPPKWAPKQLSHLSIDGKDFSTPRNTKRFINVSPKKGSDSVIVEYAYWINAFTRVTRTKVVKVELGETVAVDFNKADPKRPDKIYAIYYPTPQKVVEEMCALGKVAKGEVVYDIGCGDGRLVITAVKDFGAKKGVGIDIDAVRIAQSKDNARKAKVEDKVTFIEKDALTIKDFSEADVVLLYMSERLMEALRPTLKKSLRPGTRIVSHRFRMGDWAPDKTITIKAKSNEGDLTEFDLHLWTIKKK